MNTTNLFVELIVIGVGTSTWLMVLCMGIFIPNWYTWINRIPSVILLIPVLSVVYLLGILTDRLADFLFEHTWGNRVRKKVFPSKDDYYRCRQIILTKSDSLSELIEYGRSRMRICRGWTLNLICLIVAGNYYIWVKNSPSIDRNATMFTISIILALLCLWCWFAWYRLAKAEYMKIQHQAQFLNEIEVNVGSRQK